MSPAFDVPAIRSRAVVRPRLIDRIGVGTGRAHLALVHGAAGSGKSTLLAQWAASLSTQAESVIWVTLNPDDAGLLPFWSRLGTALVRNRAVATDSPFDALSRPGLSTERVRRLLVDIFGQTRAPLTIVLDDYHSVASVALDAQLRLLVESIDQVSLMVGSRTTSGLHALEIAARVRTVLVDASALAFTLEESSELVEESELGKNDELARSIQEASLGWPLAVQAMLVEAQRDPDSDAPLPRVSKERSQFTTEFVQRQLLARSPQSRDFLLRIALADECSIALAIQLSGQDHDSVVNELTQLELDGIGTWQIRDRVSWFRLHPLLQEVLQQQSTASLDRPTLVRLRGLLSDGLRHTRPLRALELAFATGDWQRMEDLVLLQWLAYSYYHRASFVGMLRQVPREAMTAHPALLTAELVHDYGGPVSLVQLTNTFAAVTALTRPPHEATGVVGALREIMTMGVHRLFAEMPIALSKAKRAHTLLDASSADDRRTNAMAIPILYVQSAITHLVDGQYLRALDEVSHGRELAIEVGLVGEQFQALAVTAFAHAARGDIVKTNDWLARCEQAGTYDGWLGGYLQAGYHIAKAYSALNRWDAEGALQSLAALDPYESVIEYWPYMAMAKAKADLLLYGPAEARSAFEETLRRKQWRPRSPLVPQLIATKAQLLLFGGQTARAAATLEQSGLAGHPEVDLVQARLANLQGDYTTAIALADRVVWASDESPRLRAEAQLAVAVIAHNAGNLRRSGDTAASALATLDRYGLRLPLVTVRTDMLPKLVAAAHAQGRKVNEQILLGAPTVEKVPHTIEPLSGAEKRVLRSMLDSTEVAEAAEALHLSAHTVRYHLKRSYRKLGVSSRKDAIALALELGILGD